MVGVWDGAASGIGRVHFICVTVRVRLVALLRGCSHALGSGPFGVAIIANIAKFVLSRIGALVNNLVGNVFIVSFVAFRAVTVAEIEA